MGHGFFTEDFRIDAVKQVPERRHSVADVSSCCQLALGCQHVFTLCLDEAAILFADSNLKNITKTINCEEKNE